MSSFHYPRRVKDLPQLEPDSEDDFNTPQKANTEAAAAKKLERAKNANKENEGEGNQSSKMIVSSSTKSNSGINMRIPKRSAELPALESDSEDDENVKNDNLNCAILNDSFLMSPSKSEQDESRESSAIKANKGDSSLSFIMNFNKMALNTDKQVAIKPQSKDEKPTGPTQKHTTEDSLQAKKVASNSSTAVQRFNSEPLPQTQTTKYDMETPFKSTNSDLNMETSTATSNTTAEAQFATPQIRSFSVQRRPRDLCSTQSQKTRSAIVNEFRSQKVLFQTPMTMTRVPLPNDSITLGLCDTINETADTPGTAERTPQRHVEKNPTAKSKKSLEGSFMAAENQTEKNKDKASEKSTASSSAASTSTTGKETILNIKNANYAILKKLGCGGSSSVYLARRQDNSQECALKVVDLHGDPAVVEGYLNETKLLAKLQGNVCVVSLFEYQLVQAESKLYMVMEKGDSDLHKILQTYSTSLPLYVLMNFLYQMLQAVNYIHQNGVIHSDLKPANFLMVNGRLKLIDFGIASNIAIDSTSIIKFSQAGTFNYISPEALTDTSTGSSPMRANQPKIKISTKSDVWSLGCILYLLLYKKTPFSDIKNIYAKISAISNPSHAIEYAAIPPYYPVMLVHMTKNCLQHNPKKRPSCADLLKYPFNMVIPIQNLTVPQKKL